MTEYEMKFAPTDYRNYRRERIKLQIDNEPLNDGCPICVHMDQGWGVPTRYLELSAYDARMLASYLLRCANLVDAPPSTACDVNEPCDDCDCGKVDEHVPF